MKYEKDDATYLGAVVGTFAESCKTGNRVRETEIEQIDSHGYMFSSRLVS